MTVEVKYTITQRNLIFNDFIFDLTIPVYYAYNNLYYCTYLKFSQVRNQEKFQFTTYPVQFRSPTSIEQILENVNNNSTINLNYYFDSSTNLIVTNYEGEGIFYSDSALKDFVGWQLTSSVGDSSNFYPAIIDNDRTKLFLELYSRTGVYEDEVADVQVRQLLETYNKNVFLRMIDEKLENLSNSNNSNVDLTQVTSAINNVANSSNQIANNLKTVVEKDNEEVELNVAQAIVEANNTIEDKQLSVINNLDYSDRISAKPRFSGYPEDDLII